MSGVVKTTWIERLADMVCPHYCALCGVAGGILCECCKKYILFNSEKLCLECGEPTVNGCCESCTLPFLRGLMVGYRDEPVGQLAEIYKFESVRALGRVLAEVLAGRLPCLRGDVEVVAVPTARKHIRQRGLDHMRVVARELARLRGWVMNDWLVVRQRETVQTGALRSERKKQAQEAFRVNGRATGNYLVVDDIWTTGASLKAVCELLRNAGAKSVDVAVLARSR